MLTMLQALFATMTSCLGTKEDLAIENLALRQQLAILRETKDLLLVARVLGHSHQRVTELYSHLLPGALDRARDAIAFTPDIGSAALEAKRGWKRARPSAIRKAVGDDD
jgi:hypothetical protein